MSKRTGHGWKSELIQLIATKGRVTAKDRGGRTKPVSNRTQEAREKILFLSLHQLEALGMKLKNVHGFKEKHVKALAAHWEAQGISPATLQNRISHLRTLAHWIGKTGMVGPSRTYVSNPDSVRRPSYAQKDHSWSAQGIDAERLIEMVTSVDPHVGLQLRLCHAFYLRKEEAVMFRPYVADKGTHLVVRDGTKGGRERMVPVVSDYQRNVLEYAKKTVKSQSGHVGRPEHDLTQALNRFAYVCRKCGISKDALGITPHGLRHQGLNDLYERIAGVPSPVRAVDPADIDPEKIEAARYRVAQEAGHARKSISGAYLGSFSRKGAQLPPEVQSHLDAWTRYFQLTRKNIVLSDEQQRELAQLKQQLHDSIEQAAPSGPEDNAQIQTIK